MLKEVLAHASRMRDNLFLARMTRTGSMPAASPKKEETVRYLFRYLFTLVTSSRSLNKNLTIFVKISTRSVATRGGFNRPLSASV
jgi:hypothetical protein